MLVASRGTLGHRAACVGAANADGEMVSNIPKGAGTDEELIEAFNIINRNGNGFTSAIEFSHVVPCLDEELTDEDVDEAISAADVDGDGHISYEEFVMTRKAEDDLHDSVDGEEQESTEAESNMDVLMD